MLSVVQPLSVVNGTSYKSRHGPHFHVGSNFQLLVKQVTTVVTMTVASCACLVEH